MSSRSFASHLLGAARRSKYVQCGIVLALVSPVILIGILAYLQSYRELTELTFSRRQSIAQLAASSLEQRFDRLLDLGKSLATRVQFRRLVSEGKWAEAVEILRDVRLHFPFVERVFLTDAEGTLRADTPSDPAVRDKNFSERDWYRGVTANWQPYVSEAYRRAAEPRYNVVAAAVPIKIENGQPVGILVLQVRLATILGWSNSIDIGDSGFIYFVDKKGQLVTHPDFFSDRELVGRLDVPLVHKSIRQDRGIEIARSPVTNEEVIAAYAAVRRLGWGVIAMEPTRTAFVTRTEHLRSLVLFYGSIIAVSCVLACAIVRTFKGLKAAEDRIQVLNSELRQRAAQLEASNKELEAFSYSVSHDLRAPLRAIDGFSQAIAEDYAAILDDQGKDYLKRVREGTQKMGQLIDDLLNLSRVTRMELRRESVDLTALVRSVAAELHNTDPERQVRFVIAEGITVTGDPRLLRVVIENLLQNAWKFTGKHPSAMIEFGTTHSDGKRAYFVRDDGAGFDMAYADKLFGAFQRLHSGAEFNGTGIGLATIQRIIHRHGGRVWAEGAVEQGATFYFTV